jgi:amino acid transporter
VGEKFMPFFIILIVLSFVFYAFYKVKSWRIKERPYEKRWVNAKASIALGCLLVFFAVNWLFLRQTTAVIIVSAVLIIVGGYYVYQSYRMYRYFLPLAAQEAQRQRINDDQ